MPVVPSSFGVPATGSSSTVALNLLNGSTYVSPSLLETGYYSGSTDRSLPSLLTGSNASGFWNSGAPVLLMAPHTAPYSSSLFLYSATPGNLVSVRSVGVGSPLVSSGDGLEEYLFLTPLSNVSWAFPYWAGAPGGISGGEGLLLYPNSITPYIVLQWDSHNLSGGDCSNSCFNLYLVTPGAGGSVSGANIRGMGPLGSNPGAVPVGGDYLVFDANYSVRNNTLSAQLTDENSSAVDYSLSVNLSQDGFSPTYNGSQSYYFGAGGSAGGLEQSSWGLLYNALSSSAVTSPAYLVTFTGTGLPPGTNWSVTLGGVTHTSTTNTIAFMEPNGTYSYAVGTVAGYTVAPSSGALTVNGAAVSETITFTPMPTYSVVFTESGLPSGTSWSVTLNGATESSITSTSTFTEPNGVYSYTVGTVSGYAVAPPSGTLTVNGAAVSETITFTKSVTYSVAFTETGLPAGTSWTVTLGATPKSSTTSTITFSELNGTYAYSIGDVPGWHQTTLPYTGSVTVSGSMAAAPTLAFSQVTYSVTFTEGGLPSGTTWSVTLGGSTLSTTTSTVTFSEPNGTYPYTVGAVAGWITSVYSGSVPLNGGVVDEAVAFTQVTYTAAFTQSGLPPGTAWSVTLGGSTLSTTTSTVTFTEPNGTYAYKVTDVPGWHQTTLPYSGSLTVAGTVTNEAITFAQATYSVEFSEAGLAVGVEWYVNLTGGSSLRSTSGVIDFVEPNGTYAYSIWTPANYAPTPSGVTLTVVGAPVTQPVTFGSTYGVTFDRPPGTPMGASWTVYLNATSGSSGAAAGGVPQLSVVRTTTASTLTIMAPNGTYAYSIIVAGSHSLTGRGTVSVQGSGVVANAPPTQTTFLGFTGLTGYYILVAIAVAVLVAIGVLVIWPRRRDRQRVAAAVPSGATSSIVGAPPSPRPTVPSPESAPPPTLGPPMAASPSGAATPLAPGSQPGSAAPTSFCPNCGRQFGQSERFCESCGSPRDYMAAQPPAPTPLPRGATHALPPKKKRTGLYVAVIVVLLIVVIIVVASLAVKPASASTATATYSTSTAPSIGAFTPNQGNEYFIVNMSILDNSCGSWLADPYFVYATTGGVTYSVDLATFALSNPLPSVTLQNGATTAGAVAFQVPSGSTGYSFSYNGLTACTVNWVAGLTGPPAQLHTAFISAQQLTSIYGESYTEVAGGGSQLGGPGLISLENQTYANPPSNSVVISIGQYNSATTALAEYNALFSNTGNSSSGSYGGVNYRIVGFGIYDVAVLTGGDYTFTIAFNYGAMGSNEVSVIQVQIDVMS